MSAPKSIGRGWDLLRLLIEERAKKTGPDGERTGEEQLEEVEAAAASARRLLRDRGFMQVRLKGMEEILEVFKAWVALDPSHPNYERELRGLHLKGGGRFWDLFWPEELIHRETELRKKLSDKEETGAKGIRRR